MHGASVAELVDAVDSKSTVRKDLGVRVPPLVPLQALRSAAVDCDLCIPATRSGGAPDNRIMA